jgi:hypothetical protein
MNESPPPTRGRRLVHRPAIFACWALCLVVTLLGAAEPLYFAPRAEAPGFPIGRIYEAVGSVQGRLTLLEDIAFPAGFALVAFVGATLLLWACFRFILTTRWACTALLGCAATVTFIGFVVGFGGFPLDVPDSLPPGTGGHTIVLAICALLGVLSVSGVIALSSTSRKAERGSQASAQNRP